MNDRLAQLIYEERAQKQAGFSGWHKLPDQAKDIWRRVAQVAATELLDVMAVYISRNPTGNPLDAVKHARELYAPRQSPSKRVLPEVNLTRATVSYENSPQKSGAPVK